MATNEPSLGEITSIKGDAGLGTGGGFTEEIRPDNSLQYLFLAANANAEADKRKLDQYQKNLDFSLQAMNAVDMKEVMESDRPNLLSDLKRSYKSIYDNIDVVRNPLKDLTRANEVKGTELDLRARTAKSGTDKVFLDTTQKFLSSNPAWNTPQNIKKIEDFKSAPLTERKPFQLDPPFTADIAAAAQAVTNAASAKVSSSDVVQGGKYIRTKEGIIVDLDKAKQVIDSMTNQNDIFGRNMLQGFGNLMSSLPQSEKEKYSDVKDFFTKNVMAQLGLDQVTKNTLSENSVWLQGNQQAFTAGQNALNRAMEQQRIDLQRDLQKSGTVDIKAAGELKNKVMTSLLTTGQAPISVLQDVYGDNNDIDKKVFQYGTAKDPITGEPEKIGEITTKMPMTSVVGSKLLDGGRIEIQIKNNQTGKMMPSIIRTQNDISDDLNGITGKQNASKIEHASREYMKQNSGSSNFNINWARKHFGVASPSIYTGKTIMMGNKVIDQNTLSKYTDDQISQAIMDKKLKIKE